MCDEYRKFGVVSFKLHSWVIKRMASFWRVGCIVFGLEVLGFLIGLAALGFLWRSHNHTVVLPALESPFAVRCLEYDWTDAIQADPLAIRPPQPRKLNVWIW